MLIIKHLRRDTITHNDRQESSDGDIHSFFFIIIIFAIWASLKTNGNKSCFGLKYF